MILSIDTSARSLGMALFDRGTVLASLLVQRPHCHDECLLPGIEQLFSFAGDDISNLDAVAVVSGPGSFTGLRIGMAAAKGIALARSLPLLTVTRFEAYRRRAESWLRTEDDRLVILLDAGREDVYYAVFERNGHGFSMPAPPAALPAADIVPEITPGTVLAGDGCGKLPGGPVPGILLLQESDLRPMAETVAELAADMLAHDAIASTADSVPLYIRDFTPKPGKPLFT